MADGRDLVDAEAEAALVALVRRVARAEILPRFRGLGAEDAAAKSAPDDLVTEADLAAERALGAGIAEILPDALIVGEEGAAEDPGLLDRLNGADRAVVVDPVDGTWNYAHGLAIFGTMIAALEGGETVWGLLYDPVFDDWVVARRGGGAWFVRADGHARRLTLSGKLPEAAVTFLPLHLFEENRRPVIARAMAVGGRTVSLRCSCHEYRTLLTGGAAALVHGTMKPWDHAAGALALAEAGGVARLLDGRPFTPLADDAPIIAARDEASFARTLARFGNLLL